METRKWQDRSSTENGEEGKQGGKGAKYDGLLDDAQDKRLKKSVSRVIFKTIAAVAVIAVIVSIPLFFSKKAQVKRSFKSGIAAFERLDVERTLDFISDDYGDDGGNTKGLISSLLPVFMSQFKSIKVLISKLEIKIVDDHTAELNIDGRIIFRKPDDTLMTLKGDGPVQAVMQKEDKRWRLVSLTGVRMNLEDAKEEGL